LRRCHTRRGPGRGALVSVLASRCPLNPPEAAGMIQEDSAHRVVKERVQALFRNLPKAVGGQDEPVHQIRVASRRLRVVLPIVSTKPDGGRIRKTLRMLRSLTRAAGWSRDLDVIVSLFEDRAGERSASVPEIAILRRRLRAARSRSRRRMAEALLDLDLARLRRNLREVLEQDNEAVFTIFSRLRRLREYRGGALLAEMDALSDRFDPVVLHDLRRQIRRLRYAAEVVAALHDSPSDAPKRFKELQEKLGPIHDTCVLAGWLGRQAAAAEKRGQPALAAQARGLDSEFMDLARAQHGEYLGLSPGLTVRKALALMGRAESAA